jgi:tetratricopeptide (TPR) repeat protein
MMNGIIWGLMLSLLLCPTVRDPKGEAYRALNQELMAHYQAGNYEAALKAAEAALLLSREITWADDPIEAKSLGNLALVLGKLGKSAEARHHYESALALLDSKPGETELHISLLNNLGGLFWENHQSELAMDAFLRGLQMVETSGQDHPKRLNMMMKRAELLVASGLNDQAADMYAQTLLLAEQALGRDHPEVSKILNNMAVSQHISNQEQDEGVYLRALDIRTKALGPDHPAVAVIHNNLGENYGQKSVFDKAEASFRRVVDIMEKTADSSRLELARYLFNLGTLYVQAMETDLSKDTYLRALTVASETEDLHIQVLILNALAIDEHLRSQFVRAWQYYHRALNLMEQNPDHNVGDRISTLTNVARHLESQRQIKKALTYYEQALAVSEQALGADHPDTRLLRGTLNAAKKKK